MRYGTRSPVWLVLRLALMLGAVSQTARADVGYAMQGDSRPFHQWDSMFNNAPRDEAGAGGIVWRAGDVSLRPTLGVWVGLDDNLFLDPVDPVDDTFWTLAPGLLLSYGHSENNYLTANYEYEDVNYSDYDSEDYESHLFSLGLQSKFRGYTTHLSEQYSQTTDAEVESGERVERSDSTTRGRIDRSISRRTGLEAHGDYEDVRYESDGFIDYVEWSAGGDLTHQTWPNTQTFVGLDYGQVDLHDPDYGDADYIIGSIGLRGQPTSRTRVDARVGGEHREFDDPIEAIDDWIAAIGVSRTFWRDSIVGVNVSRQLLPSSQAEGVTRVPTTISPYLQHEILRDLLAISLNGTYEHAYYYDAEGNKDRTDDRYVATAILDWSVIDPLSVGAGYTYEKQESDFEAASYERNLVFLRALANY